MKQTKKQTKPWDIIGKKFARLVVLEIFGKTKQWVPTFLCLCDCGNLTEVIGSHLKNGNTKSCGCLLGFVSTKMNIKRGLKFAKDKIGKKYGRLTVIKRTKKNPNGSNYFYLCRCDCGNLTEISSKHLNNKKEGTKSCGCFLVDSARVWGKTRFLGVPRSKETKKKMSEYMVLHPNRVFKDTSIELKTEEELRRRGVVYEKQVPLCKIAIVDFYLPEYRIVIQCDGCYWHNCPKHSKGKMGNRIIKTNNQDSVLKKNGIIVYRFWEHDINKSVERCINKIKEIKIDEENNKPQK